MRTIGFDQPLYVLPFDHRASFQSKLFGRKGDLSAKQTAQNRRSFKSAVAGDESVLKATVHEMARRYG